MYHIVAFLLANTNNCLVFVPRGDERVAMQTLRDIAPLCPGDPERLPLGVANSELASAMMRALDKLMELDGNTVTGSQAIYCENPEALLRLVQKLVDALMSQWEYAINHLPTELSHKQALSMKLGSGQLVFQKYEIAPPDATRDARLAQFDAELRRVRKEENRRDAPLVARAAAYWDEQLGEDEGDDDLDD